MPVTAERPYSTDRNLFHISYEGGILEDPWAEPPPKMFLLTNSPESAPDVPVYVEIDYEAGDPVAVDGRRLSPAALLETLNRLGGEHGIGRVDLVENRFVGHEVARRLRDARGAPSCTPRTGRWNRSRSTARCCTSATPWCPGTRR